MCFVGSKLFDLIAMYGRARYDQARCSNRNDQIQARLETGRVDDTVNGNLIATSAAEPHLHWSANGCVPDACQTLAPP